MKKKLILGIGLAIVLAASANFVAAQNRRANAAAQTAISLRDLNNAALTLDDLKGKPTVLAIGATWLPLSREQAAIANQLQQTYKARGAAVYFVATDSADAKSKNFADDAAVKSFGERAKIAVPILRDANGTTLNVFKLDQIPAFVVLNKNGEVAATIVGLDVENNQAAARQIAAEIDKVL